MTETRWEKLRYWIFPESRAIKERTEQIVQQKSELKRLKNATKAIVQNANQPDVLRNLVIAMQSVGKSNEQVTSSSDS